VPVSRKLATLVTAAALLLPVAACGESDVDKAKNEVQDAADSVKGDLNDVSTKDLKNSLNDPRMRRRTAARTRSARPASSSARSSAS
jgi:hypothetical protein